MFFEEGWSALSDITAEVITRVQSFYAGQADAAGEERPSDKKMLADIAISVWEICDAATKVGAVSPEITIVQSGVRK